MSISVGILGATGYTGSELVRILKNHPDARITYCSSRQYNGKSISDVFPYLKGYLDIVLEEFNADKIAATCDIVFSCLPHHSSMDFILKIPKQVKVIDFSADFRLKDVQAYTQWYGEHTAPDLLNEAVYGLCEFYADEIKTARLVANPGCYVTSVILPLIPLLRAGLINSEGLIADSKSGASGAGRGLALNVHFTEAAESFSAYKIARMHRHIPEIEQELSAAAAKQVFIEFTPHLLPVTRGILSTLYAHTEQSAGRLRDELKAFYAKAPFVHVLDSGLPSIKDVRGTNRCMISVEKNPMTGRAVIVSVIDNLVKGAAGQAVQNMNIMFGLDETIGLDSLPIYP